MEKYFTDSPDQLCNYVNGEWCQGLEDPGTCGPLGKVGEACRYSGHPNHYGCMSHDCEQAKCAPMTLDEFACSIL